MSFFRKSHSDDDVEKMTNERDHLLNEILPVLQEEVRKNPSDGKLHLELVKALAMGERLDEAKTECIAAMPKFSVSDLRQVQEMEIEINRLISKRDLSKL